MLCCEIIGVDHLLAVRLLESIIAKLWGYWSQSLLCGEIIGDDRCFGVRLLGLIITLL